MKRHQRDTVHSDYDEHITYPTHTLKNTMNANSSAAFSQPDCWLEVSIRKVLLSATSTQVFLGFPVPKSKC